MCSISEMLKPHNYLLTLSAYTCEHSQVPQNIFKSHNYWEHDWYNCPHSPYYIHLHSIMSPKTIFTVPLGNVKEIVTETKRTKRSVRTTTKEVPFYSSKPTRAGPSSVRNPQAEVNVAEAQTSEFIYKDAEESYPLPSIDVLDDGFDDAHIEDKDAQPHVGLSMCSCVTPHLIVCRHQWVSGCKSKRNIFISYWKWRVSQSLHCVPCVARAWRSSVMIALQVTTFAKHAAFKHTSDFHSIGRSDGLVHTFHQHHSIHLDSSYALVTLVRRVQWL